MTGLNSLSNDQEETQDKTANLRISDQAISEQRTKTNFIYFP